MGYDNEHFKQGFENMSEALPAINNEHDYLAANPQAQFTHFAPSCISQEQVYAAQQRLAQSTSTTPAPKVIPPAP